MKTKVIFRKFRNGGDVIALFPADAGTNDVSTCSSYQHMGQHSAASVYLSRHTVPATRKEYAPLARELRSIGYKLRIVKRFTRADWEARKQQIAP